MTFDEECERFVERWAFPLSLWIGHLVGSIEQGGARVRAFRAKPEGAGAHTLSAEFDTSTGERFTITEAGNDVGANLERWDYVLWPLDEPEVAAARAHDVAGD